MKTLKVVDIYELDYMPFDRCDADCNWHHATGRMIVFNNGTECEEEEDDWTVDYPLGYSEE